MSDAVSWPFMRTPLSEEQAHDLRLCYQEWLRIRTENGYDKPPSSADIYKGALLGRMTLEGKPPHPTPPPKHYSRPWWEVIENNGADLHGGGFQEVYGPSQPNPTFPFPFFSIRHDIWRLVRENQDGSYVITHERAPGDWLLRHRTEDDPQVVGGTTLQPDGSYGPFYLGAADWLLIGPDSEGEGG